MITKGYKCFNIKCGSCIGKTLCGEPEDTALGCVNRVAGKPMTNADRIRAMSDMEIAEASSFRFCPSEMIGKSCVFRNCKECWIEWLKQPAGEEEA